MILEVAGSIPVTRPILPFGPMKHPSARFDALSTLPVSGMRILLSNDDGLNAPGLAVLEKAARSLSDDVWIVAPQTEQSAASHSLTIHAPLRLIKEGERRFAVTGTPTDAVLLAVKEVFAGEKLPDLVLSGVNRGGNLGEDVTYSGTIAAAMEATLLDIPAIAFSQCYNDIDQVPWETAATHLAGVVRLLVAVGWQANTLMNVNFPPLAAQAVQGVKAAAHGRRAIGDKVTRNTDPKGRPYYWIGGDRWDQTEWVGSDITVINEGSISVTPLSMDLTDYKALSVMKDVLERHPYATAPHTGF